jgi:hypothetical protein
MADALDHRIVELIDDDRAGGAIDIETPRHFRATPGCCR